MDALLIPVFVIFTVIVPVVLIALLLYAVPVRISAKLMRNGTGQTYSLGVSWAGFGIKTTKSGTNGITEVLIGKSPVISSGGSTSTPPVERAEQPSGAPHLNQTMTSNDNETPPGTASESGSTLSPLETGRVIHIIRQMIGPAASFGSVFMRAARFVDVKGKVILGLGDPVLTGEVCGMYWASRFILQASRIYLELEPVFGREVLELDVTVRFRIDHPLLILLAAARLGMDPGVKDAFDSILRRQEGAAAV